MKIMIMLLMPLLISAKCSRVDIKLTCAQIRSSKLKAMPLCDISFQENRCRCRCFSFSTYETVEDDNCLWPDESQFFSGNYELETCEGISGFFVTEWAREVGPKVKKLNNLYGNICED